jgi:hypothetical protein
MRTVGEFSQASSLARIMRVSKCSCDGLPLLVPYFIVAGRGIFGCFPGSEPRLNDNPRGSAMHLQDVCPQTP